MDKSENLTAKNNDEKVDYTSGQGQGDQKPHKQGLSTRTIIFYSGTAFILLIAIPQLFFAFKFQKWLRANNKFEESAKDMKFANLKQDLWISICCAFVLNYVKEFYCWLSSPVLRHLRKVNPE